MADFDPKAYLAEPQPDTGSGFDPKAYLTETDGPGLLSQAGSAILGGVSTVGRAIDRYSGAPVRAAVGALQDDVTSPAKAVRAYADQFGADPSLAPTGKDIARRAGVPDTSLSQVAPGLYSDNGAGLSLKRGGFLDPTASGVAGFGVDVATDPLSYIPVGKVAESVSGAASKALGSTGDRLWIKATGASGKDAAKFAPGTADAVRQIGRFGDGPAQIADKAQSALDAAEASKQAMIQGPLAGASVDRNTIYNAIQEKIADLSGDESKIGIVKQLDSKLEDITGVAHENGTVVPLSKSEEIRRGFDAKSKWNSSSDADAIEANKITANIYRKAGEDAATAVDPALGAQFKADKTTQKILIPVQEAAEKRALQLQQSPHGGLLDLVALGGGGSIGAELGGPGAALIGSGAAYAAKALRPRYASMGAATADQLAKVAPIAGATVAPALAGARGANFYQPESGSTPLQNNGQPQQLANRTPAIGEDKWAQQGLQGLGIQDPALSQKLLSDPKAKQLLIQASDLKPGSKAMQQIMNQLKSGWGSK